MGLGALKVLGDGVAEGRKDVLSRDKRIARIRLLTAWRTIAFRVKARLLGLWLCKA